MLTLVWALGGCGGMGYDAEEFDSQYPDLTFALRVEDPDGKPIGGARVFVDGERDDWWTESEFESVGSGFSAAWRGFETNWIRENYQIYSAIGSGKLRFDVAVRKAGWTDAVIIVQIEELTAQRYHVRGVLTMYPAGGGPADPPLQYAEVVEAPVE